MMFDFIIYDISVYADYINWRELIKGVNEEYHDTFSFSAVTAFTREQGVCMIRKCCGFLYNHRKVPFACHQRACIAHHNCGYIKRGNVPENY